MTAEQRAIAFHLPQFHPIPENDEWWGRGFTEWTNVARAKPLFAGHQQPHLPADLGFYDLRLTEARIAQAEMAREYGVGGFCFYHYWFNGRRILNRPVDDMLHSGAPEFPFCLCWANENWTRRWDGGDKVVLMAQEYGDADDIAHAEFLCTVFEDPRYIRVNGRPLFLVYRASDLPSPRATTDTLREVAERRGIGSLYLCNVRSQASESVPPESWGFDACVDFAPRWSTLGPRLRRRGVSGIDRFLPRRSRSVGHKIFDYRHVANEMMNDDPVDYVRHPCVTPMWDNTSRRKHGATILVNSTPERYEEWLRTVVLQVAARQEAGAEEAPLVFINAWNEWAEGNHLEPCQRWGHAYLEATRRALSAVAGGEDEGVNPQPPATAQIE